MELISWFGPPNGPSDVLPIPPDLEVTVVILNMVPTLCSFPSSINSPIHKPSTNPTHSDGK